MKNKKFISILSLSILILIGSIYYFFNGTPKTDTYSITLPDIGFDTVISFKATCTEKEFEEYVEVITETFKEYNAYFDQYNAYENLHNIHYLNENAYQNKIEVDEVILDCLNQAFIYNELNPNFDCTQGALLNVWHEYREEGTSIPDQALLEQAKLHVGKDKIKIEGNTIEYLDPDFKLDLGGIAKGYTAQKVKEILNEKGLYNGFINAGGNVVLLGPKENGTDWKIGIQDPNNHSCQIFVTFPSERAIVTSGDYQRYYEVDGIRYHHIIDLKTGYPSKYARSVTIVTDDSTLADFLSTALFCMDYQEGMEFIQELKKTEDVNVVWIFDKGRIENPDIQTNEYDIAYTEDIKDNVQIIE